MLFVLTHWFASWNLPRLTGLVKLALVQGFIVLGLLPGNPAIAADSFNLPVAQVPPAQTEKLAKDVRDAAENSFNGLETTKELIGKTKYRKDAIGYGRTKASQKLKALSDKLEASEGQIDRSLTPTEKIVVDQLKSPNSGK